MLFPIRGKWIAKGVELLLTIEYKQVCNLWASRIKGEFLWTRAKNKAWGRKKRKERKKRKDAKDDLNLFDVIEEDKSDKVLGWEERREDKNKTKPRAR